jgi:hypothetical protein
MRASSARNKGGRFENYLVTRLQELDQGSKRNYASGSGLDKGDIRVPSFDFNVEAKNANTVKLVTDFGQAERQCVSGGTPVLMIRNPKKAEFIQTFVVMDMEDWLKMLGDKTNVDVVRDIPENLKWKMTRLKQYANDIIKEL